MPSPLDVHVTENGGCCTREDVVEVNSRMLLVFVASLMVHTAAREADSLANV